MKSNLAELLSIMAREIAQPRDRPFTIILEGNTASGKTTFLNYFEHLPSIDVDLEPLDLWCNCNGHNLLALQYEDPAKWSATFQSYIQLTYTQLHLKQVDNPVRIIERSIYSARYCFIENMIREKKISPVSALVLDKWFIFITDNIPLNVDLIVYLRTSPEVAYKRKLARSRPEDNKVTYKFIKNFHDLHEEWLVGNTSKLPAPVLIIDGDREQHDFEEELLHALKELPCGREHMSSAA